MEIPVPELKKKKESLYASYRKYRKMVKDSCKSGAGEDEVYKPVWFAYGALDLFLGDGLTPRTQINTTSNEDTRTVGADDAPSTSYAVPKTKATHLKEKHDNDLMQLAANRLRDKPDKYQNWALSCAADLNKMEPTQQILAKNAIAAIVMEGQLGLLHRNTLQAEGTEEDMDDSECIVDNTRLSTDQLNNEDPILTAEPKRRKRKIKIEYNDTVQSDDSHVDASTSRSPRSLESRASRTAPSGGDRHEFFGKYIICKLRELPKQQQLLAEKLINEVLFEAECSQLTMTHKLTK
ncbi:hypothetical protein MSG28_007211 [Choristoneura fumiferana]|uniref:Uncharacterized protein n=1 Tax=Choristoneura fumiferana TaxID=7141 RepID=A0ACC0JMT9_CHOFU|nr:hypothetical protein MSG28_007211 [Choristoneura fumiferana]